jgi:hypothetical protein
VSELLVNRVIELLESHGIAAARRGDWIFPAGAAGCPIRARITLGDRLSNGASARLDVELAISSKESLVESFAGLGSTSAEAEDDAFANFCRSSFHVLAAAFYGHSEPDQVTSEVWQLSGRDYDATIGNYTLRSFQGGGTPLPHDLFPRLEDMIRGLPSSVPLYWIRAFYCNLDETENVSEVLLNNEQWPAAESMVASLGWERRDSYYSARLFIVLRQRATGLAANHNEKVT